MCGESGSILVRMWCITCCYDMLCGLSWTHYWEYLAGMFGGVATALHCVYV